MQIVLHPCYFPNIAIFSAIAQNEVIWETADNFQKQTYRNRCYIATDRGRHMLTLPIKHVGGSQGRQKYKDVRLDNTYSWQRQHWRTLQTAYRTSPFFEFYEDELEPLFREDQKFLLDFNLKTIATICACLQIETPTKKTMVYEHQLDTTIKDARFLVNAKLKIKFDQEKYNHVFEEKHGFLYNLSILDLLFNEGTNALSYLKNQNLNLTNA
ncbi:WbqC family protein [Costertonia aggregata]|uniref:WbqC family protein n=1 Tax=Costertonia aggregata TaxID=343403 RepID=A0A7H9AL57_9FLAO|nr:WbqC family protein [Costertonia aggregata]QLG44084.1 WbqC family protein [Costertonia aggregata]